MLDLSHLPQAGGTRLDILVPAGAQTDFQVWNKPRNCSFVYILALGPGGGGGGGNHVASGAAGGGGGGGSGSLTRIFAPAQLLPNQLLFQIGRGGAGGAAAGAGSTGTNTFLRLNSNSTTGIAGSSGVAIATSGTFGGAGTTAGGNNGTGGAATTAGGGSLLHAALWLSQGGLVGIAGAATSNTTVAVTSNQGLWSGGNGGAGNASAFGPSNGGGVERANLDHSQSVITVPGGLGSSGAAGGNGTDGFCQLPSVHNPYSVYFLPGAGGGNSTVAGGRGGNGSYGCGGGGGGSRQGATSGGGAGGRGGDGIVIIWSF